MGTVFVFATFTRKSLILNQHPRRPRARAFRSCQIDGPPPADAAAQGEPYVDCTTLPDGCAPGKQSVDGTGADDPTVVQNDLTGGGRDAGETVIIDGRK